MAALFLDRDGVLNVRTPGGYIVRPDEFIPAEGMEEALRLLASQFYPIVVVTNQSGIAKNLMDENDLRLVHLRMSDLVADAGGRIDAVYFCPHASGSGCPCRKPATGMAWQALIDFPGIEFSESWLVGDSACDIDFGSRLGMQTVLIDGKTEEVHLRSEFPANHNFKSLLDFARFIC